MTVSEIFPKHGTVVGVIVGPTLDEIRSWPATVDVRRAALAIGISSSWLYQLINEGAAPIRVIKIGSRARVVTASLIELLEGDGPG